MYGCHLHHALRMVHIRRFGIRDGWETFDQWHLPRQPCSSGPGIMRRDERSMEGPRVINSSSGAPNYMSSSQRTADTHGAGAVQVVLERTPHGGNKRRRLSTNGCISLAIELSGRSGPTPSSETPGDGGESESSFSCSRGVEDRTG